MKRRDLFALLGGMITLPLAARAHQKAMPVIVWLEGSGSRNTHGVVD